jgi:hypothetical protein
MHMSETEPDGDVADGVYELDDVHVVGPNLDIPAAPADLPYEQLEDWRSAELLAANGIPATRDALLEALASQTDLLLAAAAHASWSTPDATPQLRRITEGPDDWAAVEAANALVRLGETDALEVLHGALARPVGPFLSPLLAAGYLAQHGDPSGASTLRAGLDSSLLAARMLACKQLFFLLPYEGRSDTEGRAIDVAGLFEAALGDEDPSVREQAAGELRRSDSDLARTLLE